MLFVNPIKAQWGQTLIGQSSLINGISVVNDNVVWVKDQKDNSFSITINGGESWVTKNLPIEMSGNVGGFSALSATTAFVILSLNSGTYNKGIYKTINGGESWVRQPTGFNPDSAYPDVLYFWNENEGVAIGDAYPNENFEIYTTSNGGLQWNIMPIANMPNGNFNWSYNDNMHFKILGNSIFFQTSSGRIFKSKNKGLTWTVINTPMKDLNFSFDFKDENNGLLTYESETNENDGVYSTKDGGLNWTLINSEQTPGNLKYMPTENVYFLTHFWYGLSYSADNGQSWTKHPSFESVGMQAVGYSPLGKIFIGGWKYLYNTSNYTGVNLSIKESHIIDSKSIDITFSENVDITSAQVVDNYFVDYRQVRDSANKWIYNKLNILSATVDNSNQSVVHLTLGADLPFDTIYTYVYNVEGLNNFSVINKSSSSTTSSIYTNLTSTAPALDSELSRVYPNPVSESVSFSFPSYYFQISFELFDLQGRKLIAKTIGSDEKVNMEGFRSGMYLYKLNVDGKVQSGKLVKE